MKLFRDTKSEFQFFLKSFEEYFSQISPLYASELEGKNYIDRPRLRKSQAEILNILEVFEFNFEASRDANVTF